ncbi:MAG: hypothetical protein H0T76_14890 [Nannocystis sp.]|nr:hypothetical protein [Nannocystis sp.]MBA3547768.1 hypothetical protein [Nannocystis sp.]
MNETTPPPSKPGDDYAPVVGISQEDTATLRMLEGKAADKTARDYEHIVWAYGVLWALFAAYGLFLWRRSARLRADMNDLQRALDRTADRR